MRHVFIVTVHAKVSGFDDFDTFHVEAIDDKMAREEGLKCFDADGRKEYDLQYVEIEHVLDIDN